MPNKENILGIVMCGGLSTRMHTDKGLCQRGGKYWSQIIAEKFLDAGIPFVFSINASQSEKYREVLGNDPHFIIDTPSTFEGPLKGLMRVHTTYPNSHLLPIACDMLDFNSERLRQLLEVFNTISPPQNIAYKIKDTSFFEPFGAIYNARLLKQINDKNTINTHLSLQMLLKNGQTHTILISDAVSFNNYNSEGQLYPFN